MVDLDTTLEGKHEVGQEEAGEEEEEGEGAEGEAGGLGADQAAGDDSEEAEDAGEAGDDDEDEEEGCPEPGEVELGEGVSHEDAQAKPDSLEVGRLWRSLDRLGVGRL